MLVKRYAISAAVVAMLCFAALPLNAYAQTYSGMIGFGKNKTNVISTKTGSSDYYHQTTNINSRTKGGFVAGSVSGVPAHQMAGFYRNEIKPYVQQYAQKQKSQRQFQPVSHEQFGFGGFSQPKFEQSHMPSLPSDPNYSGFQF